MLNRLRSLFGKNKSKDKDVWASVVLLQREAPLLDEVKVMAAATAAFKNVTLIASKNDLWVLQIATTFVSVTVGHKPYFDPEPHQAVAQESEYDRAWAEQRAWVSLDLPQSKGKPKDVRIAAYRGLLPLAEKLWTDDCTGLYLPAEGITAPNMGNYGATLRWSGMNRHLRKVTAEFET
jgi:hypothetical protein